MGNVYSFYAARELFREPLVLINSDLVFAHEILSALLASTAANAMVVDDRKKLGIEEMKVAVRDGLITCISKELDPAIADGEYIGMLKVSPSIAEALEDSLHRLVQSAPDKYYEDAFQLLISEGIYLHKVSTGGAPCMEIDTFEDLALARNSAHLWV
jgi:choline kinase